MEPLAKNLTPQVLCFQYFMEKTNSTVQSYCELFLNVSKLDTYCSLNENPEIKRRYGRPIIDSYSSERYSSSNCSKLYIYLCLVCKFNHNSMKYSQHIIQRLGPDQEFYIIAYSIGTIFALEVVKLLEAQGRKGYIWCLDGSPDYLLSWKENEFVKFNVNGDEAIQCFTCVTLLQKLVPERIYEEVSISYETFF